MTEHDIQRLHQDLQKTRVLLRDQAITSTILRAITKHNVDGTSLSTFCELFHAHSAYLLFFAEPKIISMNFFSVDPELSFKPPPRMQLEQDISMEPIKREGIDSSLFGAVAMRSSISYPLVNKGKLFGLLEIGWMEPQVEESLFLRFQKIMLRTERAFLLLYDRELKTKELSATKKSLHATRTTFQRVASRFEVVFNDSRDLIVSIDQTGRIFDINPAGCVMLGYKPDEMPEFLLMLSPDFEFVMQVLNQKHLLSDTEAILKTKDGTALFCIASFSLGKPIVGRLPPIHCIFKNITERVKMQQDLWSVNIELSAANDKLKNNQSQMVQQEKLASIGELAAGVAHEINNPLAFVTSNYHSLEPHIAKLLDYMMYLEKRVGTDDPDLVQQRTNRKIGFISGDIADILKESKEGLERIMSIVLSLKDFSRVDTGGHVTKVDLNQALQSTITVARNSWKYVAKIETEFALKHEVECSASELNQVFLNIIVNAAQAIESQKRQSPGTIKIATSEDAKYAYIHISDDGPGIPAAIRDRIYEPFFTTKEIGKGTGLGLSICYDIVINKHGGSLQVSNNQPTGTCFTVKIPIVSEAMATDAVEV